MELASLRSPVDQFFDRAMIMDKDEQIRQNRLALLKTNYRSFCQLCWILVR